MFVNRMNTQMHAETLSKVRRRALRELLIAMGDKGVITTNSQLEISDRFKEQRERKLGVNPPKKCYELEDVVIGTAQDFDKIPEEIVKAFEDGGMDMKKLMDGGKLVVFSVNQKDAMNQLQGLTGRMTGDKVEIRTTMLTIMLGETKIKNEQDKFLFLDSRNGSFKFEGRVKGTDDELWYKLRTEGEETLKAMRIMLGHRAEELKEGLGSSGGMKRKNGDTGEIPSKHMLNVKGLKKYSNEWYYLQRSWEKKQALAAPKEHDWVEEDGAELNGGAAKLRKMK